MRLLLVAALLALPTVAAAHNHRTAAQPVSIRISCFRGPWQEIIWDRPEVVFLDGLTAYGYSPSDALAIGTRVCHDPQGVTDPSYLVGVLQSILRTQRPR